MYEIGNEELTALEMLFESKKLFRYQGDKPSECSQFEKNFSSYLGRGSSLVLSSGTNALILAMQVLGVKPGDEVIIPSYTFIADVTAVKKLGAVPVIVRVDENLNLDLQDAQKKITSKTKALILVYMDGLFPAVEKYEEFCRKHHLLFIEDVAQALGGEYQGRKLGAFGDASCFSFNVDKIISAGEGGLVNFREEDHYRQALMLHDMPVKYGRTYNDYLKDIPYEVGHSMRVSEITGAILNIQLKRLPGIVNKLRMHRQALMEAAPHLPWIISAQDSMQASTQLLLKMDNPQVVADVVNQMLALDMAGLPLYGKPVHCYWQWLEIVYTDRIAKKSFELEMMDQRLFLSSILKIPITYDSQEFEKLMKFVKSLGLKFDKKGHEP